MSTSLVARENRRDTAGLGVIPFAICGNVYCSLCVLERYLKGGWRWLETRSQLEHLLARWSPRPARRKHTELCQALVCWDLDPPQNAESI